LQDSGLKRAKAVAMKRNGQSQRQAPAFREVQVTGTNSGEGMHRDFIQMISPKSGYTHHRGDVPAEASVQSWPLCTQTQASKVIRERRFPLKRPNRSMRALGHLHQRGHLHPWRRNPYQETLSEGDGTSQSNPKRNNPSLDYRRGVHPIYRQALITAINGALIGTVAHDCQSPVKD